MLDISYECVNVSVEKYILIPGFLAFSEVKILEKVLCHYIIFSRHFNFEFLKKIESQRERERGRERKKG